MQLWHLIRNDTLRAIIMLEVSAIQCHDAEIIGSKQSVT